MTSMRQAAQMPICSGVMHRASVTQQSFSRQGDASCITQAGPLFIGSDASCITNPLVVHQTGDAPCITSAIGHNAGSQLHSPLPHLNASLHD